jgi:hypothetical protein
LRIVVEAAGPDRDNEGFPNRLSARIANRLVFTREKARDGRGHALDVASSANGALHIRELAETCRGDVVRHAF